MSRPDPRGTRPQTSGRSSRKSCCWRLRTRQSPRGLRSAARLQSLGDDAGRPTLGIALGSGSARGWAHVGVLRALAAEGIAPDLVAGCSMDAMIGATFAAGHIEQLEAWALALDWKGVLGLLDVGFARRPHQRRSPARFFSPAV